MTDGISAQRATARAPGTWWAWLTADPRRKDLAIAVATAALSLTLIAGSPEEYDTGWPEVAAGVGAFVAGRHRRAPRSARRKGIGDFVTTSDIAAERMLRGELLGAWPAHGFLGEETPPERPDADFVWVVDPSSMRVRRTPVVVGELSGAEVEVRSGLSSGDWIAISGVHSLREGMEVRRFEK